MPFDEGRLTLLLDGVRREAAGESIPVIRLRSDRLLCLLCRLKAPRSILEIGSAIGYSALSMWGALEGKADITTIERDPDMARRARENIRTAGADGDIRVIEDDAAAVLDCLSGPYDMIFMDAAKGQYPIFLPRCIELLAEGGLLVCDDVLYRGLAAQTDEVPHKMRTMVTRLRDFRADIVKDKRLYTALVDIEDGLSVSIKQGGGRAAPEEVKR